MNDEVKKAEKPVSSEVDGEQSILQRTTPKNFIILGVVSLLIPIITVAVSLFLYDFSGDKYLDRSRPGYMPEESSEQPQEVASPSFSDTGVIDKEVLMEYLEGLDELVKSVDGDDFFSETPLSDASLGITDQK